MPRRLSADAEALIKQWEKLKLQAYRDSGGVWTIGWGHTKDVRPGQSITPAQAQAYFEDDIREALLAVDDAVMVPLSDNQFGALVSFTFNVGAQAFKTSTLLKKLNRGDYASVPSQMMRWVHDNGARVDGLVNRRAAEVGLWSRGSYVSSNTANAEATKEPMSPATAAAGGAVGITTAGAVVGVVKDSQPILEYVKSLSPELAIGIVLIALALGAWYLWKRRK